MRTPFIRTFGALMLALALLVPDQACAGEAEWRAHMNAGMALLFSVAITMAQARA